MWFFLSLFSALFDATKNVLTKHKIHRFHSLTIAWTWALANLVLLVPLVLFSGWVSVSGSFWWVVVLSSAMDVVALIIYIEGLRHSDLSLSLPMLALSPLVLTISSLVLNGEAPNQYALVGITMVIVGLYFLNFKRKEHWFAPIMAITQQRGTLLIALVALLWGVSGALHKRGLVEAGPFFYLAANATLVFVMMTPIAILFSYKEFKRLWKKENLQVLLPIATLDSLGILTQVLAKNLTYAVFVISVKRMSIILAALLAWIFLGERIKSRILPILILVLGVMLIALSQYFT